MGGVTVATKVRRSIAIAASALVLASCSLVAPSPSLERAKEDAFELAQVLPSFSAWRVTDFERGRCRVVVYMSGSFAGPDEACKRFDSVAIELDQESIDLHDRLSGALGSLNVQVDRMSATYDDIGRLRTAHFVVVGSQLGDTWEYVYDPDRIEPKRVPDTRVEFLQVNDDWWLVVYPDD